MQRACRGDVERLQARHRGEDEMKLYTPLLFYRVVTGRHGGVDVGIPLRTIKRLSRRDHTKFKDA